MLPHELPNGCRLRLFRESDAEELHRLIATNQTHLADWLPWAQRPADVEERRQFIRAGLRQHRTNDGFQAAIVERGAIVGVIGFHHVDWQNRATSIGYWLAAGSQGRGTMTEAVHALLVHAFDIWELERVEIRVAVGNERSAAIPRRLGFSREGVLRHGERHADGYKDIVVYSLLRGELI
jgi:ribosomal-protein-serine acetyltransferase